MKIRDYFIAILIVVGCTFLFAYLAPAAHAAGESVGRTKPGRPVVVPKYTKRDVDDAGETRLCDLANGRECTVVNHTDADLCLKATADLTCGSTTIDCTGDNDILLVKSGETWTDILDGDGKAVTSTLCGRMATTPTGDCALTELGCIYTSEIE